MGTLVTSLYNQAKHELPVTTVASSAIAIPDSSMAIFIGTAMEHRQLQAKKRLWQAQSFAREHGFTQEDAYSWVTMPILTGGKGPELKIISLATITDPTENNVMLLWHKPFPHVKSTKLLADTATRLCERWAETKLKAA